MKPRTILAAGLLLLFAVLALAGDWTEKKVVVPIAEDGVQRIEITAGSYYFDPNTIVVKVNVPVEFVIKKAPGATPHNIALKAPEAGIDIQLSLSTDPQKVKFTPTKTGKYEFSCTKKLLFFKSHKDHGMYGFLEVVD